MSLLLTTCNLSVILVNMEGNFSYDELKHHHSFLLNVWPQLVTNFY